MFRDSLFDTIPGLLVGTVVDNKDKDGLYRVQVKYVTPSGDINSAWARMITCMGGKEMGFACIPEKEDEVLLRFVNGHPDQPIVVGSVHNGKDKPPFDNSDGKNDERIFWSRNLHKLTMNDKKGKEFISIESTDGKTTLKMDTKEKAIAFTAKKDVKIIVGKTLKVAAGKNIEMTAKSKYAHSSAKDMELKSGSKLDIKGTAGVSLKGPKVEIKGG